MAAPSNDPPTSSQQQAEETAEPPPPQLKPPPLPTYASSEQSEHYQSAKVLLNEGQFESALQLLEEGLEWTKVALIDGHANSVDLHEAMAPFHYLYGTTLLYSVEESQDPQQAMMNDSAANAPEGDEEEQPDAEPATDGNAEPSPAAQPEDAQQLQDDMEIAWENLESARLIITLMLVTPQNDVWQKKLRNDLAQVMLRIGDLERWNGQYESAIQDYEAALEHLDVQQVRKRAEIHSNLGAVYLNQVASVASSEPKSESEEQQPTPPKLSPEQMAAARLKGFEHHYQCAVAFSTLIAEQAGIQDWQIPAVSASPSTTTTVRADLKALREIVHSWKVPEAAQESILLLDELQETLDEAETAETALQEATQLKEQITAAVAAQQDEPDDATTNAFGVSTTTVAQSTAVAQPMMMVKKKKKAPETTLPPSKRPKNE